ncbi:hypothetical protein HOY82DRAFT_612099 [Tuber indicum]|nr:hypothetical protein HOY82DRAFT_612099 [Tuber indicum]
MSEDNLPLNLSQTTSIDTIWDFEIQNIEHEPSLPVAGANSDFGGSPSISTLSTAPSGLLTPTLGSNTADGSSSGADRRIYERRRKVWKSWVYHPENGGEYATPDGRTRWLCARCPNKRSAATLADTSTKNMIEHLRESHKISKHGPIQIQLEKGQIQIETAFGNTRPQIIFNQELNKEASGFFLDTLPHVTQLIAKFHVHFHNPVTPYDHG